MTDDVRDEPKLPWRKGEAPVVYAIDSPDLYVGQNSYPADRTLAVLQNSPRGIVKGNDGILRQRDVGQPLGQVTAESLSPAARSSLDAHLKSLTKPWWKRGGPAISALVVAIVGGLAVNAIWDWHKATPAAVTQSVGAAKSGK